MPRRPVTLRTGASRHREPTQFDKRIGERLRSLRERIGLTQEQLGQRLDGLQAASVGHYESGRTGLKVADFPRWAKALEVSQAEFEFALGLGLRLTADEFALHAAAKLGPDQGQMLTEAVDVMASWTEPERQRLLDLLRTQVKHFSGRSRDDSVPSA